MEAYKYTALQSYHANPEVEFTDVLPVSQNYFANIMGSHVDAARHVDRPIASANSYLDVWYRYSNYQPENYVEPMQNNACALNF